MDHVSPPSAALIAVLGREVGVLQRLLYSHRQLRVLFEAGDSRFLGLALDELSEVMTDLGVAERLRGDAVTAVGATLPDGPTSTLNDLLGHLPTEDRQMLSSLQRRLGGLIHDVDVERRRVRTLSHARVADRTGHRLSG